MTKSLLSSCFITFPTVWFACKPFLQCTLFCSACTAYSSCQILGIWMQISLQTSQWSIKYLVSKPILLFSLKKMQRKWSQQGLRLGAKALLFYKGQIVISNKEELRTRILHEMHETKIAGHSKVLHTFKRLQQQFYWPRMHHSIQEYVWTCPNCLRVKIEILTPVGLLQPLPIPCQVWEDITINFIDGLRWSQGMDTIMVFVNRLNKSTHFFALSYPYIAKTVANKSVEEIIKLHGITYYVLLYNILLLLL